MFVWPLPPDGQHGLELNLQFKTDIIASRDGQEQRNAARPEPRLSIGFTDWRAADEARKMRQYFHNRLQQTTDANAAATEDFLMPIWTETQVVYNIYNDGNIVLFDSLCRYTGTDIFNYLTNGIESILGTLIFQANSPSQCAYRLKDLDGNPLAATIAAKVKPGWLAIPCLPVRLTPSVTRKVITADITEAQMTFPVSPGKYTPPAIPEYNPADHPNHLLDRELFDFPIDIKTPVDIAMLDNSVRLDYGRTDPVVFHNIPYISETYKIAIKRFGKADIDSFMDFYRRHEGMRQSFYWPSHEFDFIAGATEWTGNGIRVKGQEARDIFYHRDVRDADGNIVAFEDITTERIQPNPIVGIAIFYKGEWVTNIVDTVQKTGDDSYLVCRYPFPEFDQNHLLTDKTRISILHQARFATDEMTFRYTTPEYAEISTGIQTIPYEGDRRDD